MPKKSNNNIKPFIISAIIFLIVFFVLMIIFSCIATKVEMSDALIFILPFSFVIISSFVGGSVYGKIGNLKMTFVSLILSAIECLILCIVMIIFVRDIGFKTIVAFALSLVSSFASIYIVKNKRPKRKI